MDIRHTRAWAVLRAELRDLWHRVNAPCWLCGQPIDYDAPAGDPNALDADHVKDYKAHPHLALDRNNIKPAHARCNRSRGNSAPAPALGATDEDW